MAFGRMGMIINPLLKRASMGIMSQETEKISREHKCKWSIEKILWQKHQVFGKTIYTI